MTDHNMWRDGKGRDVVKEKKENTQEHPVQFPHPYDAIAWRKARYYAAELYKILFKAEEQPPTFKNPEDKGEHKLG